MNLLDGFIIGFVIGSIANVVLYRKWQSVRRQLHRIQNDGMVD